MRGKLTFMLLVIVGVVVVEADAGASRWERGKVACSLT